MCVWMHVHVLVDVNVGMIMCILVWIHVHVCVAPPIVVGAWPIVGTLWRLFEYYYYCSTCTYDCTSTYMYIHVTLTCAYMYIPGEKISCGVCAYTLHLYTCVCQHDSCPPQTSTGDLARRPSSTVTP